MARQRHPANPCRGRHHHHPAQYLAGQLPHRRGPIHHLSAPGDFAAGANQLWLPDHLRRAAKLLHPLRPKRLCQRQDQHRPRQHRARCRTLPARPRRAFAGNPAHSAEPHRNRPPFRQRLSANLDARSRARHRQDDRRRFLHWDRLGTVAAHLLSRTPIPALAPASLLSLFLAPTETPSAASEPNK